MSQALQIHSFPISRIPRTFPHSRAFSNPFPFRFPSSSLLSSSVSSRQIDVIGVRNLFLFAFHQHGSLQEIDDSPVSIDLLPICSETQFHRVIAEAQQLEQSVIILWMASWCRKCIYLKPKLERLAADYYPRLRFYCVDVNAVPHKLVAYAGVTKMPTIQLWKDGKKEAEVIGGHKAYLVVNDIREMIETECTI